MLRMSLMDAASGQVWKTPRLPVFDVLINFGLASVLDHGYGEFSTNYRCDPLTPA